MPLLPRVSWQEWSGVKEHTLPMNERWEKTKDIVWLLVNVYTASWELLVKALEAYSARKCREYLAKIAQGT